MVSVFNAGPAKIPDAVLRQVQAELLNFAGTGMSVLEISHRSAEFTSLIKETTSLISEILEIPENYRVLWMAGGASAQFSAIPLNLIATKDDTVDYIVTGSWSKLAAKEAEKYTNVNYVIPPTTSYTSVPSEEEMSLTPGAKYVYYCDNETVVGVEYPNVIKSAATLVCDMSSNFLSRPVDVSKFGIIYAGVQKNVAPAGLAVLIIREDLISTERLHQVPRILDYKLQDGAGSCLNTPNVFSIYCTNLVLKHIVKSGGLKHYAEISAQKSKTLYDIIDNSAGFYSCKIEKDSRSRMNVTFNLSSPEKEAEFVKGATGRSLIGLKGHRSVGGVRASIYNAVTLSDVQKLADYMNLFKTEHN